MLMLIEGGILEKIDLEDKSLIYNPLFDQYCKKNAVYYDMEQYLSIKSSMKHILPLPLSFQSQLPTLSIPIPIQVSNFHSNALSLTPFQLYKNKSNVIQTVLELKQQVNSQKNIYFKVDSSPVYHSHSSNKVITSSQIKNFKRRLIGSYSSCYYNKVVLDRVKDFNVKNKSNSIRKRVNVMKKKEIYIKPVIFAKKMTNLLRSSIIKKNPFDRTLIKFNVRIQKNN